jgi:Tol biopolymer transport system component
MMLEEQIPAGVDADSVRAQLAKIVGSLPFIRSSRIGDFLTFVVENTLAGNPDVLKEICIGSMVFAREPSYDPKIDPIVRVEARRLRSKLQEYYETEGLRDTILITMPKGGYRPVIESRVVELPEAPGLPTTVDPAAELNPGLSQIAPSARPSHKPLLIALIVVNAVLFAVAAVWLVRQRRADSRASRIAPLTSYVGQEFDPALSPDGRHLAFVWDGDGSNYDIYIKSLPSGDAVRITTDPAHDLHPAWSPDGRDLAFLRVTPAGTQILIVPSTGGPEHVLGELHDPVSVWMADATQIVGSLGPAWSPDGESLVVDDGGALYLWPLALGARRQLTQPASGSNDFYPAISPDGRSVAFVRQTSHSTADLYLAKLNDPISTAPRRLTNDKTDIRGIAWAPDGRSIVFSSERQGSNALWQVFTAENGSDAGRIEAIATNSTQAADPSLSRGSDLLAYTELTQNTNIWRVPVADASHSGNAIRLIASSRRNNSAQYSPDGQQIAFISDRSGSWELWACKADGSAPHQLTNFHGPLLGTPHWSPDSRWIAFDARPGDHSAIFVIAGNGGEAKQLSRNSFEERMPNWSADGKYIYFSSTRSGAVRLWKMTSNGDNPVQITDRAAYDSFEADSGRTVYFRSDGAGLWSVPANGGIATAVAALAEIEPSRYLAVTSHALYFVDREDAPRHIKAYNFATHRVTSVGQIDRTLVSGTPSLSVSSDERFIIYAEQDESGSDIFAIPWNSRR